MGTSFTHLGIRDTVQDFLPKDTKNKGLLPAAIEGKTQQTEPHKLIGHQDPNKIQKVYPKSNLPSNVLGVF